MEKILQVIRKSILSNQQTYTKSTESTNFARIEVVTTYYFTFDDGTSFSFDSEEDESYKWELLNIGDLVYYNSKYSSYPMNCYVPLYITKSSHFYQDIINQLKIGKTMWDKISGMLPAKKPQFSIKQYDVLRVNICKRTKIRYGIEFIGEEEMWASTHYICYVLVQEDPHMLPYPIEKDVTENPEWANLQPNDHLLYVANSEKKLFPIVADAPQEYIQSIKERYCQRRS